MDGPIYPNASLLGSLVGGAASGLGGALQEYQKQQYQSSENQKNRDLDRYIFDTSQGNMFKYQENQNSFLSSLSAQNSTQWLKNQRDVLAYQQELAGYRTPGAVAGVNRAGLGYEPSGRVKPPPIITSTGSQATPSSSSSGSQTSTFDSPGGSMDSLPSGTFPQANSGSAVRLRRSGAVRIRDPQSARNFVQMRSNPRPGVNLGSGAPNESYA